MSFFSTQNFLHLAAFNMLCRTAVASHSASICSETRSASPASIHAAEASKRYGGGQRDDFRHVMSARCGNPHAKLAVCSTEKLGRAPTAIVFVLPSCWCDNNFCLHIGQPHGLRHDSIAGSRWLEKEGVFCDVPCESSANIAGRHNKTTHVAITCGAMTVDSHFRKQ